MDHTRTRFAQLAAVFVVMAVVAMRCFPSLYGDEYGSLREAADLTLNPHSIGYSLQLRLWMLLGTGDVALRVLSVVWAGIGLLACYQWLRAEGLTPDLCAYTCLLLALSPFFWQYAACVRFYSFFLASSMILFWRASRLAAGYSLRDLLWFVLAALLALSAHLFATLCLLASLVMILRVRYPRMAWGLGAAAVCGPVSLLVWPTALRVVVGMVERLTGVVGGEPVTAARGLSAAMLAKIPLTVFFFSAGEHLHPAAWALTVPTLAVVLICAMRGVVRLRDSKTLGLWVVCLAMLAIAVYAVFDPLAPATLQGASQRYVIFAFPVFWAVVAAGAFGSRALRAGLVGVQCAAFLTLVFSDWSYSGFDRMDWRTGLRRYSSASERTCIVVDGRSEDAVKRYAPGDALVSRRAADCGLQYGRVLLVTNDYRESILASFDEISRSLYRDYDMVENMTVFPAQVTAFQRSAGGLPGLPVSRLTLPEADLRFPIEGPPIEGFVRLDGNHRSVQIRGVAQGPSYVWSSFRARPAVARGTPVLKVRVLGEQGESLETVLRAGIETASWRGGCDACRPAVRWRKRLALVGRTAYEDAYRDYKASVWSHRLPDFEWPCSSFEVTSLLETGSVYFWGIHGE